MNDLSLSMDCWALLFWDTRLPCAWNWFWNKHIFTLRCLLKLHKPPCAFIYPCTKSAVLSKRSPYFQFRSITSIGPNLAYIWKVPIFSVQINNVHWTQFGIHLLQTFGCHFLKIFAKHLRNTFAKCLPNIYQTFLADICAHFIMACFPVDGNNLKKLIVYHQTKASQFDRMGQKGEYICYNGIHSGGGGGIGVKKKGWSIFSKFGNPTSW